MTPPSSPLFDRRELLRLAGIGSGLAALSPLDELIAAGRRRKSKELRVKRVKVTPIALPDPPLLAAGGCHGPYFLRTIVELETEEGITGIGETYGNRDTIQMLDSFYPHILGRSVLTYRNFGHGEFGLPSRAYTAIEVACLDAIGRATGRRVCELLGGPVREEVEFAAYLFFRYAADHSTILDDRRIVDDRGSGDQSLDDWGEVRTPEAMAEMAMKFHQKWGFRVQKLKAGVFEPEIELEALRLINQQFKSRSPLRIDPNGRWTMQTALRIGEQLKQLPLDYYEDPVAGQAAMGQVRAQTGLRTSTNSCVTSFSDIPGAVTTKPVDVVLCDHHFWGGITACQALGRIADVMGWELSQHSNNHAGISMAAMIHTAAVTPQLTSASDTHYPWLIEGADIIEGPNLAIREGKMQIPDQPGLGVDIDQDKLARGYETYRKSRMLGRDDAATMRRLVPGWKRTLF